MHEQVEPTATDTSVDGSAGHAAAHGTSEDESFMYAVETAVAGDVGSGGGRSMGWWESLIRAGNKRSRDEVGHGQAPQTQAPSGHDVYFALGANGTGVSFHFHAETMLLLHGGRKRWFLYPPSTRPVPRHHDPSGLSGGGWTGTPPAGSGTAYSEPLWVCDQEAGDAVYLPSGWHHATVNFGATLGVALQVRRPARRG